MRMETKMEISRLCLILVGEEWTGKSSAGNTMLGQKVFQVDNDTEHVMQSFGVIEGRNVTVVDTPGWNSECSPDVPLKILKKGHNSVSLTCKGFHILLLTIPISQDQKWNKKLAQRLSNALSLFNNDIWKHTMLLFTRGDLLHSTGFEGYLKGSGQPFQSLVEKCECRYHVLDNHKWNDHKQVRELLEKIEQVVQENDSQSLQLVMSEQRKTLRRNEKFKMEEPIRREICFRLEDYMFKSLRPEENEPPDPTDQWELLRSNEEMLHPGDMQGAAHEYSHIQDLDTEFTHDLYSESSAEINRGLTMSSNYDCDTESSYADPNKKNTCTEVEEIGMDRIGDGDKEKNKRHVQHATLQRNTPQTWDDFITCVISSHQQTIEIYVLQVSVCLRKIKPSCQTGQIFFTAYGDNITWLFIMVLYLLVKYLCLIYKTYEVSTETGDHTMNTLVSGFAEHQHEPTKEIQEAFNSVLWQIANNKPKSLDEKITECSKMEDNKQIPQHSTGGKGEMNKQSEDEVIPQHTHKDNKEDEDEIPQHGKKGEENEELPQNTEEEKQSQQIEGANEEIPHQSKKGDKRELPQHNYNEDGENMLQQKKRVVDDHTRQHSIKKDEKQIFQNNKRDNEVTHQQRNADEGEEKLKLKRNSTGCGDGELGNPKDVNNNADTKNGKKNPNIVERRQQSPKMNALSSSKLNHKVVRETEKTLDIRRVEFGGTRKSVRSQDARDEDKRENGSIRKMRRSKSLERFTVFSNAGEEDTIQQLDIKKIRRTKNLRRFITFNRSFHSRIAFPPSEGKRGSYSSSSRQSPPPKISKDHPRGIIRNSHLANSERRDELFAKNGRLWNGKNLTSAQNGRSWQK